jgi:hypothetical protein
MVRSPQAAYFPCTHTGPCVAGNCSCVDEVHFCTKSCVSSTFSRNFFPGCKCRNGACRTKVCPCFAAKRECDPDVCTNCQACTDAPGTIDGPQRCRNDSISFKRNRHLLVAESGIPEAGWGLYVRSECGC